MNFRLIFFCTVLFISFRAYSQVILDNDIIFTNSQDSAMQIYNVSKALDSTDAINQDQVANNTVYSEAGCNGNILSINSIFPLTDYTDGTSIEFIFPSCLTESTNRQLSINNLGPIQYNIINQLDSIKYLKGKLVKILIYQGTALVFPASKRNNCPPNYVKINQNYCIQYNRNIGATFWDANKRCSDNDAHLCTPEEWITACLYHSSKLANMPLNWEWLNSGSNHNLHAPIIGNNANCNNIYTETTAPTGLTRSYRCCYKLK